MFIIYQRRYAPITRSAHYETPSVCKVVFDFKWWSRHYRINWTLVVVPVFITLYFISSSISHKPNVSMSTVTIEPDSLVFKLNSTDIVSKIVKIKFSEMPVPTVVTLLVGTGFSKILTINKVWNSDNISVPNVVANPAANNSLHTESYEGLIILKYIFPNQTTTNESKTIHVNLNIKNTNQPSTPPVEMRN